MRSQKPVMVAKIRFRNSTAPLCGDLISHYNIILEGKPIGPDQKKELMDWRTKV
jgi:hypothetical protein